MTYPASSWQSVPPPPPGRSRAPLAAIVAVSVVGTLVACAVLLVLAVRCLGSEPPPFQLTVEKPEEVGVGETFAVEVRVRNSGDRPLDLGSLDVDDSLLDGFRVVDVEPLPEKRDHTLDFSSFYVTRTLAPGESAAVTLRLEARREGVWTGDVDACTPDEDFVTSTVTIRTRR